MNHRHLWLSFLGPALWEVDIWATERGGTPTAPAPLLAQIVS